MKKIIFILGFVFLAGIKCFAQITITNDTAFINVNDINDTRTFAKPFKVIIDTPNSLIFSDLFGEYKLINIDRLDGFTYSTLLELQEQIMHFNFDPVSLNGVITID